MTIWPASSPYPIDLSGLIDEVKKDEVDRLDMFSVLSGDGYMPEVFDFAYVGFRGQSAYEARKQHSLAKADQTGGVVFEYSYFKNRDSNVVGALKAGNQPVGIFGFTVVKDEEELRNRLSIYYVMTS